MKHATLYMLIWGEIPWYSSLLDSREWYQCPSLGTASIQEREPSWNMHEEWSIPCAHVFTQVAPMTMRGNNWFWKWCNNHHGLPALIHIDLQKCTITSKLHWDCNYLYYVCTSPINSRIALSLTCLSLNSECMIPATISHESWNYHIHKI